MRLCFNIMPLVIVPISLFFVSCDNKIYSRSFLNFKLLEIILSSKITTLRESEIHTYLPAPMWQVIIYYCWSCGSCSVGRPFTILENRHRLLQATNTEAVQNAEINGANWNQCEPVHDRMVLETATACCAILTGTFCCHIVKNGKLEGNKNTKIVILKATKFSGNKVWIFFAQSYTISTSECPMMHDLVEIYPSEIKPIYQLITIQNLPT